MTGCGGDAGLDNEVLALLCRGHTDEMIARALDLEQSEVAARLARLMARVQRF